WRSDPLPPGPCEQARDSASSIRPKSVSASLPPKAAGPLTNSCHRSDLQSRRETGDETSCYPAAAALCESPPERGRCDAARPQSSPCYTTTIRYRSSYPSLGQRTRALSRGSAAAAHYHGLA